VLHRNTLAASPLSNWGYINKDRNTKYTYKTLHVWSICKNMGDFFIGS